MQNVESSLIIELEAKTPDREVVFTAIETLKKEEEIRRFYQQHIASLTATFKKTNLVKSFSFLYSYVKVGPL